MDRHDQENGNRPKNVGSFLAGLVVGGLVGAGAVLLLAPQSGKKTRAQVQQKSIELRDETVTSVEGAVAQVRGNARERSRTVDASRPENYTSAVRM